MMGISESLVQISTMAYGSGVLEGTSGGRGHIGMINGRAVKFDTHGNQGGDKNALAASCNDLRKRLLELSQGAINEKAVNGQDAGKAMTYIRKQLGLDEGGNVITRKLLSRSAVAKVLNKIESVSNMKVWSDPQLVRGTRGTSASNESFAEVAGRARREDVETAMKMSSAFDREVEGFDRRLIGNAVDFAAALDKLVHATVESVKHAQNESQLSTPVRQHHIDDLYRHIKASNLFASVNGSLGIVQYPGESGAHLTRTFQGFIVRRAEEYRNRTDAASQLAARVLDDILATHRS